MSIRHVYAYVESPIDPVLVVSDGDAITGVYLPDNAPPVSAQWVRDDVWLEPAREQLRAYFAGERREFDLPLSLEGTAFQKRVWDALTGVPYGETASYRDIAARIGEPKSSRAVGAANGRNPVSIVIPCHRVVGASGRLTGYGGGLERKRWLIALEQRVRATGRG